VINEDAFPSGYFSSIYVSSCGGFFLECSPPEKKEHGPFLYSGFSLPFLMNRQHSCRLRYFFLCEQFMPKRNEIQSLEKYPQVIISGSW
jgi:hypothetical protein